MATTQTAQCGNVDPFTKGICQLPAGHAFSHEVRFGPRHAGHCTSQDVPPLSCPVCA